MDNKLFISTIGINFLRDFNDIISLHSEGKTTIIRTTDNQEYKLAKLIGDIEPLLNSEFYRVNRSTIININHIKEIPYNSHVAITSDNNSHRIAVRRKLNFFERITQTFQSV